jgi:hypothetical protein
MFIQQWPVGHKHDVLGRWGAIKKTDAAVLTTNIKAQAHLF